MAFTMLDNRDKEELIRYVDENAGTGAGAGANGLSAYEIAVENGFEGTEAEWLDSLKGADGTSITITGAEETQADGEANLVFFSDGSILSIRNGRKGTSGTSVKITGTSIKEDGSGQTVYFSDGNSIFVANGKEGAQGDDYTLTEADKEEIAETVKAEVPFVKTAEQPTFVNGVNEMTDTSKVYVMPDGYMWAYMTKEVVVEAEDLFQDSGYQLNYRHSSSGVTAQTGVVCSGLIPIADAQANDYKLRIKGLPVANLAYSSVNGNRIAGYKANGTLDLNKIYIFAYPTGSVYLPVELDGDDALVTLNQQVNGTAIDLSNITHIKVSLYIGDSTITDADVADIRMTFGEDGVETQTGWMNTGNAFVPADYENRILNLEQSNTQLTKEVTDHEERLDILENNAEDAGIPSYWIEELKTKDDAIQQAMESAGRNKSAFLWYTDSHWTAGNAKISPMLLNYLYKNTPMNKVNFGGDIIGDPTVLTHDTVKHLYNEWRNHLKGLPNHHSVLGNHDNLYDSNITYAYLIAPEESSDMVMGGEFYYYIDNPCEKTRYLYLDSGTYKLSDDETRFIIDSLGSVPDGWHIVVISHIWFQYESASNPSVGSMNAYMQKALNLFDAYNARESGTITMVSESKSYDFTDCGGKVEFCIGGHIHIDLDLASNGGIPVIITASETNQDRSKGEGGEIEDFGTIGTISESAIYGIIADYNKHQVTVVGVGRGGIDNEDGSRVVNLGASNGGDDTEEAKNYADTTSADWLTGYRLSTSSTSPTNNTTDIVTNYIPCKYGEIVTIEGLNVATYSGGNARYHMVKEDNSFAVGDSGYVNDLITKGYATVDGNVITIQAGYIGATGSYTADSTKQRFCGKLMDGYTAEDVVITVTKAS